MCCVEWFVRDAKILAMQNFRSVKVLVRCLELLRPSQTTSPHHIPVDAKNFTLGAKGEIESELAPVYMVVCNFSGDAKQTFY